MDVCLAITLSQNWQIALLLTLLGLAVLVFAFELVPVDVFTLILLLVLVGTGMIKVQEAFAGLVSDVIIMLASVFVLGAALRETGVLDAVSARLIGVAARGQNGLVLGLLSIVSGLSAFMNNTTVTALFVGPVMNLAQRAKLSPSKLLLPVAYASILGGTCTLIGTSTNVAVSSYIARENLRPLGLFEITPVGLILVVSGILYLTFLGRRLLPANPEESLTDDFEIRDYLSEIVVLPGSELIGQRVFKSALTSLDFRIVKVMRGSQLFVPDEHSVIAQGDILLVTGRVDNLMKVKTTKGIDIKGDVHLRDQDLEDADTQIAEALITPNSVLVGRTLRDANYHRESGLMVLAIYRRGRSLREQLGSIRLKVGDLLLVQGRQDRLESAKRRRELAVLQELKSGLVRPRKALYAGIVFVGVLILGGLEIVPVSMAFLTGAILVVLLRCLPAERIYDHIDWRLLILIGGMTAFGTAMDRTGAAAFLASWIVHLAGPLGVYAILAGFFVLTVLLTQPMSNAAAALVVLPVALESAQVLGANERTFAIAIMLAASVSFITPFEPSCILVYGPGKYRFSDFVKSGVPLTALCSVIVLLLVPVFWPLQANPSDGTVPPRARNLEQPRR
jgi:di/tricarboxylate transporter